MFLTIIFFFPLISLQNRFTQDKTLQLPLYVENLVDVIHESGYIYKYHIYNDRKKMANLTYCQVRPQHLDIEIEQQLQITHKTEQDFELNFLDGKFYGQSEFIQSAVINNYGIIILTSDKNLTFISHDNINQTIAQTKHFQIQESIENSYLIQIEDLNLLILLLQNNSVYEYEVRNNTYYNKTISFLKYYKQQIIQTDQIYLIKVYSTYIFILFFDGSLIIYNRQMELVYKFEQKILHYEFQIVAQQFKIYIMYQNTTIISKNIDFKDNSIMVDSDQILITKPKAVSFKLYDKGILVVVEEDDQGHIIIDYRFKQEKIKEINMQYISQKVKHIIIHGLYAILLGEKTQSIITVGVDAVYLNQQNYKKQANLLVSQILDVLIQSKVTNSGIQDYVYAYTRTRFLKLNLQTRDFEIVCACQSQEEAQRSPYYYELEYYNSECEGCQKKKSYTLTYKYAIITKEDESIIIKCIIIGFVIIVGIIGFIIKKYFAHIRYFKEAQQRAIKLETINSQPIDFSINDSKIALQLEVPSEKQNNE